MLRRARDRSSELAFFMTMANEMATWEGWLSLLLYGYFLARCSICRDRSTRCDRRDAAAGPEKICQRPAQSISLTETQVEVTS
jgi:hypothetical protein